MQVITAGVSNLMDMSVSARLLADREAKVKVVHETVLRDLYETNTLEYQRKATGLGNLLKKPIPITTIDDVLVLVSELFEHVGDIGNFVGSVQLSALTPAQDKCILAVAQASGSGKTKLAFSTGMKHALVIVIRVAKRGDTFSEPFRYLIHNCLEPLAALRKSLPEAEQPRVHDAAVDFVRVLEGAYVEWVRLQLAALKDARPDVTNEDMRLTALRCVRNGKGDAGVLAVLEHALKSTLSASMLTAASGQTAMIAEHNAVEEWLSEIHGKLRKILPGVPIMVSFDEVAATLGKVEGAFASLSSRTFDRDLFCGVTCAMKSMDVWVQSMCGTYFDIIEKAGVDNLSPLRGQVTSFTTLPLFTEEMMMASLETYLDLGDMHTETLRKILREIRGRPIHFFNTFWSNVVARLTFSQGVMWSPDQLQAVLEESAREAVKRAQDSFRNILRELWTPIVSGESNVLLADLCIGLYLAVKMRSGKLELLGHESDTLMKRGILNIEPRAKVADLSAEPALVVALERLGDDKVKENSDGIFNLISRSFRATNSVHLKGSGWEEVFALHLLKEVIRADGCASLESVLKQLFPPGFVYPCGLSGAKLSVKRAVSPVLATTPFHALFDEKGEVCVTQMLHEVDIMAGADLVFPIICQGGRVRLGLVQQKAQEKPRLLEMLRTSSVAWQYTTGTVANSQPKASRREFAELVRAHERAFSGSVRVLVSAGGFAAGVVELVNALNAHYPDDPILLCQSSEVVFGALHSIITQGVEVDMLSTSCEAVLVSQTVEATETKVFRILDDSFLQAHGGLLPRQGMSDELKERIARACAAKEM